MYYMTSSFPKQKISYKEKQSRYDDGEKKWWEACTDSVIANANNYFRGNRASYKNKMENYKIYNNQYDSLDFSHLTDPFPGFTLDKDKLKCIDKIQPFDLVSSYFKLLLGEEVERNFNPIITVVNPEAKNEKLQEKEELLKQYMQDYLTKSIDETLTEENKQAQLELIEQKIVELGSINFRSKKEIEATHLLNAVKYLCKTDNEFLRGVKDMYLASEEFYRIGEIGKQPYMKRINPLKIYAEFEHDEYDLSKALKICEWDRYPLAKAIDDFYEYLTDEQIGELEADKLEHPRMFMDTQRAFEPSVVESISQLSNDSSPGVDVYRCTWKTMVKLGIYSFMNEDGTPSKEIVDENFKLPGTGFGERVEWFWISEYYETVKIDEIYINLGSKTTRFGNSQNLSECRSGYAGRIYEADNAIATSMMDRLKPWIYLYISTWFNLEEVLKQNRGNLPTIDTSMIPDGWEPEKWMFYATKIGYSFSNSFNEGKKGQATGKLAGNMGHSGNSTINLDKGNAIQGFVSILEYIERRVGFTAGIPAQRLGEIQSKELVGNTERVVNQSSYITQYLVDAHTQTKLTALEMLINVAKDNLLENTILQYMSDDNSIAMHKIDPNLQFCDLGLFLTNEAKDIKTQESIKGLLDAAIRAEKIELGEVASVMNSNSTGEIERKLKKADASRRAAQQAEQQAAQKLEESKIALETEKMNREDLNRQLDRENKIQVAEITVLSRQQDLDLNKNGMMDTSEIAKSNLEASRLHFDMEQARAQNEQDKTDQQLKDKELNMKYELDKEKNEIDRIKAHKSGSKSSK